MASSNKVTGLYAIADTGVLQWKELYQRMTQVLAGGARFMQYRDKRADSETRLHEAKALVELCARWNAALIINDDIDLAADSAAAGVHLGRDDADIATARERLGAQAIIGASCYNEMDRAADAVDRSADYIAFGRLYGSLTKPGDIYVGEETLASARRRFDCPIVAIGGLTPQNSATVLAAGADALAVIGALLNCDDSEVVARQFAALFNDRGDRDAP